LRRSELERALKRMAHAFSFPTGAVSEHRGLTFWMNRTLEELSEFRSEADAHAVHDLRVALRRCRSIAAAIEEIDPHPEWQEMRRCARKLFRSLGDLRDTHVMTDWLSQLHPGADALKDRMLNWLASQETSAREKAQHRAERFDEGRWKELSRSLNARMRRVPADGDAAHCLALERLEEAKELHRRAMRNESHRPWHALRIGIKRFRYSVECLLPKVHVELGESLKRVQEVLGNIHDLDVLAEILKKARKEEIPGDQDWETRIEAERQKNVQTYRQMALGTASIWNSWLAAFPRDNWEQYGRARIGATRAAMVTKSGRSVVVARLALRIWCQLRARKVAEIFSDKTARRILEAAAKLSGIDNQSAKKPREKSARTFLLKSPVPPRWTFVEWERVAWAIRFQSGAEPGPQQRRFSKLSADQQAKICLHAGILRLAIAAQKCGVKSSSSLRIDVLPQGLLLHAGGAEDSPKNAARFAEAKRLMERSLGKTILVQAEPQADEAPGQKQDPELPVAISIVR
jgi:CHAD domain-containing protein